MCTSNPTVLFFDSGVGGLSVYQEVKALLPNLRYLYCFDNAYFPYSEKSESCLIERAVTICEKICTEHQVSLIVVACNTASTVVLPSLRAKFNCPIVGTVPAIKPAAQLSKNKVIGLLATKGTIQRDYVDDLIQQYAQDCQVKRIGSTEIVQIAEEKLQGIPVDFARLNAAVQLWHNEPLLDTVVLGCTHFPLLKTELAQCLPQVQHFVDSGRAIASRIQSLLPASQNLSTQENWAYCTAKPTNEQAVRQMLSNFGFNQLKQLTL